MCRMERHVGRRPHLGHANTIPKDTELACGRGYRVETLSDHLYVHMELKIGGDNGIRPRTRKAGPISPRWR
jgi:hypothetical protein